MSILTNFTRYLFILLLFYNSLSAIAQQNVKLPDILLPVEHDVVRSGVRDGTHKPIGMPDKELTVEGISYIPFDNSVVFCRWFV